MNAHLWLFYILLECLPFLTNIQFCSVCFLSLSFKGAHHQKYAKWKAAYIHKCLKNGETPVAGPVGGEDEDTIDQEGGATPYPSSTNNQQPAANTGPPTGFPGAYPPQPYPSDQTPYPSNQTPYPSNQTPYPITPAQPTLHQVPVMNQRNEDCKMHPGGKKILFDQLRQHDSFVRSHFKA